MYSIKMPSGAYLEGAYDIQFELNNQVFAGSSVSLVPGSFSLPITIPLTPANTVLLDQPHLVTNARAWKSYQVWVFLHGIALLQGELRVSNTAGDSSVSAEIIVNAVKALKEKDLTEIDLGGTRTISGSMLTHAKNTSLNPLDYDYVFCPVYNPGYLTSPTLDDRCLFQNFWNLSTDVFEVDHAYPALTPFPRVEYLLQQIFSELDYSFQNRFQTTDELRRLCLYNGRSLWGTTGLASSINLIDHVPKMRSSEWLKQLMSTFCLGLFSNPFSRTNTLIALRDLISRPPVHDWTEFATGQPDISTDSTIPDYLQYEADDSDAVFSEFPPQTLPPLNFKGTVSTLDELDTGGPYDPGIYFVTSRHTYYYAPNPGASPYVAVYTELGRAPVRTGESMSLPMSPLFDHQPSIISGSTDVWGSSIPYIKRAGHVSYMEDGQAQTQEGDNPNRLLWYRGHYINPYGGNYPLASSLPWDGLDELVDTYSLRMDGDRGIYAQWWGAWHNMLKNGKHVVWRLALPAARVVDFSFQDKIRILNMDYFVKRLRIGKPLSRGRVLVEASLISTI